MLGQGVVDALVIQDEGRYANCHGRECPSVFQCKSLSLDMISGLGARDPERVLP